MNKEEYLDDEYFILNAPRIKSVADWELILREELKNNINGYDFIHKVLFEMYKIPNYTIFCKEFEKQINSKGLNLRVGEFRDRIRRINSISFDEQIRPDTGTDRAWNIPFKSSEEINNLPENKGRFCWTLREELIEAMENIFPYIKEYRNDLSKQYVPIEYHDNSILKKKVILIDSKTILDNAMENAILSKNIEKKYLPKIDYTKKQIRNKIIGDSGEEKIVHEEIELLNKANRNDLAKKVEIVQSDAYGYDINSFYSDGTPKHIEVKTSTNNTEDISFYISDNEVKTIFNDEHYELHYLYSINQKEIKKVVFSREQLINEIIQKFMTPTQYLVEIKKNK